MGPFPGIAVTFDAVPRPGQALMDEDRVAFERAEALGLGEARLRWFRWDRPTISLGYGQDAKTALDLARCALEGVPVVVRPTGGRAVLHADEWTYSALAPLDHPLLGGTLRASCRAVVALVARALAQAYGLRADGFASAPAGEPAGAGARLPAERAACFGRSFGHELTAGGRKLMGSAQRRGRRVFLQQGSLLVGPGQERLARYLRDSVGEPGESGASGVEAALREATTHLSGLLGARPDPAAFESVFRAVVEAAAGEGAAGAAAGDSAGDAAGASGHPLARLS